MIKIRPATQSDISAITGIYNEAIANTTATFDTDQKSIEEHTIWFRKHDKQHPVIVAEQHDVVIGWASLSRWSDRSAYDGTAELSVYVHHEHRGKGIGKKLMEIIVAEGHVAGLHTILSRITIGNENSIHLHELLGFNTIGVMKEVGFKFGVLLDVQMMQKML